SVFLFQIFFPSTASALTGGPSQPEVQSFEPIGTTEMVDLFTGDFKYNIPLMEVDGYPVNISYSGGINTDQEASWVGLGWNLNPGSIDRNMRGLPDDFNGDEVTKKYQMKKNWTTGTSSQTSLEIFGKDFPGAKKEASPTQNQDSNKFHLGIGASYKIGLLYNSYDGFGLDISAGINAS